MVRNIKPDHGGVQTNVRLRNIASKEIWLVRRICKMLLHTVQGLEERKDMALVRFLTGREACFVDAIVDRVVHPIVHGIDVVSKMDWKKTCFPFGLLALSFREKRIEGVVEHPNDFAALVVHH